MAAGEADVAIGANILHMKPLLTSAPERTGRGSLPPGPDFGFSWNAGVSARSPNPAGGQAVRQLAARPAGPEHLQRARVACQCSPNIQIAGFGSDRRQYITVNSNVPAATAGADPLPPRPLAMRLELATNGRTVHERRRDGARGRRLYFGEACVPIRRACALGRASRRSARATDRTAVASGKGAPSISAETRIAISIRGLTKAVRQTARRR